MMAGIRNKDTKTELLVRRALHARGFRFRLHVKDLPGKPDLVFPKYGAVIFINGCFWHGHDCRYFKVPGTRTEFWLQKIGANKARDQKTLTTLTDAGWRVGVIWECAVRSATSSGEILVLADLVGSWLVADCQTNREFT